MMRLISLFTNPRADGKASSPWVSALSDAAVAAGILALFGLISIALPGITARTGAAGLPATVSTNLTDLPYYALRSVARMLFAMVVSLAFSLVYGLAAARSRRARPVLVALLDVLQSVPVLGFLSATVTIWLALFPNSMLGAEAASVFAIFTSQAWNMAYSFYRSLRSEPAELVEMSRSLRLTRWQRFWKLDVPCSMVPLLWNAMMSMGGSWFFLTASEMISVNGRAIALPGIGSFVAACAAKGDTTGILVAIAAMAIVVLSLDFLLWKPLTAWGEKFRLGNAASEPRESAVLNLLRRSHLPRALGRVLVPVAEGLDRAMRVLGVTGGRRGGADEAGTGRNLADILWAIAGGALLLAGAIRLIGYLSAALGPAQMGNVLLLGLITFARVATLTIVCSLIWVPVGVIIGMNERVARIAQPVVQLLASFPANFAFPFAVGAFAALHLGLGWGSIVLMALGSQWYILFNVIAGASVIPADLRELARSLQLPAHLRWSRIYLPAVIGPWCTGAVAAAGGAWNASIVAEVVTANGETLSTAGLGSFIAAATSAGDAARTIAGVTVMAALVVLVNRLVWRRLQSYASKRFTLV